MQKEKKFQGKVFAMVPGEGMFWEDTAHLPLVIAAHQSSVAGDTVPSPRPRA